MLQIAIWGICIMLVVKALDVFHRQAVAASEANSAPGVAITTAAIAILGAVLLFILANQQVRDVEHESTMSRLEQSQRELDQIEAEMDLEAALRDSDR